MKMLDDQTIIELAYRQEKDRHSGDGYHLSFTQFTTTDKLLLVYCKHGCSDRYEIINKGDYEQWKV